jgi:hypothetical protein
MKNDINLLSKRKTKTYSSKKVFGIVLLLLLLVGGMYAGIALPSAALRVAKLEAAVLEGKLSASSQTQQGLTDKSQREALLALQLTELKAISEIRSDVSGYLGAVEKAQPSEITLSRLAISKKVMSISGYLTGLDNSDEIIATFCLRLREQGVFSSVYLLNTTTETSGICTFSISVSLPSSLDSETLIQSIEHKDDVTPNLIPAPEVNN